jgi:hypothetical protein
VRSSSSMPSKYSLTAFMRSSKGVVLLNHFTKWPRAARVYGAMGSNTVGNALACVMMGLPPETSSPKSTLLRELYSLTTSPSGRAL